MSGRKNTIKSFKIVDSVSMGGDIESDPVNIEFLDNIAIQLNFTGTGVGTFAVEVSLDHETNTAGTFVAIDLSPAPAAVGSADSIFLDLNQLGARWIRVTYTSTSGTGTLNAFLTAKEI